MTTTIAGLQETKYRWAWWAILLNLMLLLFLTSGLLLFVLVVWQFAADLFASQASQIATASILCFAPIFCVLALLFIAFFIQIFGGMLFSYVKITASGIEYRKWPSYGVRCKWEDVERRGTYRSFFGLMLGDLLYLRRAEPVGWQLTMSLRRKLGLPPELVISLTGIQGWPNGQLAEQLNHYIPEVMAGRSNQG